MIVLDENNNEIQVDIIPPKEQKDKLDGKRAKNLNRDPIRKEAAIKKVTDDIINGVPHREILDKLQSDGYKLGHCYARTQSNRIVKSARDLIAQETRALAPRFKETVVARLNELYYDCKYKGDVNNAIKILGELCKLYGLYDNTVKVEGSIKNEIIIDFGFNEKNDVIDVCQEN